MVSHTNELEINYKLNTFTKIAGITNTINEKNTLIKSRLMLVLFIFSKVRIIKLNQIKDSGSKDEIYDEKVML
jgi:hypothetical protein